MPRFDAEAPFRRLPRVLRRWSAGLLWRRLDGPLRRRRRMRRDTALCAPYVKLEQPSGQGIVAAIGEFAGEVVPSTRTVWRLCYAWSCSPLRRQFHALVAGMGFEGRSSAERRMRPLGIVQLDHSTPTGPRNARFSIHGIPGLGGVFTFTRWSTKQAGRRFVVA